MIIYVHLSIHNSFSIPWTCTGTKFYSHDCLGKSKWKKTLISTTVNIFLSWRKSEISQWFGGFNFVQNCLSRAASGWSQFSPSCACFIHSFSTTLKIGWRWARIQEYKPWVSVGLFVVLVGIAHSFYHRCTWRYEGDSCSAEDSGYSKSIIKSKAALASACFCPGSPKSPGQNPILPKPNSDFIMLKLFRRADFCLLTDCLDDYMLLFQLDSFIFLCLLAKWTSDLLSAKCWKNYPFTPSTWWTPAESLVGNKAALALSRCWTVRIEVITLHVSISFTAHLIVIGKEKY